MNKSTGELAQRKRQPGDAESELLLLRLGTRKEEIEAAQARVTMLVEELRFLKEQQSKLMFRATVSGVVSAPRLREKVGQFMPKGMPIRRIEIPGSSLHESLVLLKVVVDKDPQASLPLEPRRSKKPSQLQTVR